MVQRLKGRVILVDNRFNSQHPQSNSQPSAKPFLTYPAGI